MIAPRARSYKFVSSRALRVERKTLPSSAGIVFVRFFSCDRCGTTTKFGDFSGENNIIISIPFVTSTHEKGQGEPGTGEHSRSLVHRNRSNTAWESELETENCARRSYYAASKYGSSLQEERSQRREEDSPSKIQLFATRERPFDIRLNRD